MRQQQKGHQRLRWLVIVNDNWMFRNAVTVVAACSTVTVAECLAESLWAYGIKLPDGKFFKAYCAISIMELSKRGAL